MRGLDEPNIVWPWEFGACTYISDEVSDLGELAEHLVGIGRAFVRVVTGVDCGFWVPSSSLSSFAVVDGLLNDTFVRHVDAFDL